ncbi:MAG: DUF1559 domain-containing protein [Pirellulales bacterium]
MSSAVLHSQPQADGAELCGGRSRPLEHREPVALAARRHVRRRSIAAPQRPRRRQRQHPRRAALSLLKNNHTKQLGLKNKRLALAGAKTICKNSSSEPKLWCNRPGETPLSVFMCPSRGGATFFTDEQIAFSNAPFDILRKHLRNLTVPCDYAANGGGEYMKGGSPPTFRDGDNPSFHWDTDLKGDTLSLTFSGINYVHRLVRAADVEDGLSNTFLVGEQFRFLECRTNGRACAIFSENSDNPAFAAAGHSPAGPDSSWAHNRAYGRIGAEVRVPIPDISKMDVVDDPFLRIFSPCGRFGSAHASLCHFVLGDGSVRPISFTIDPNVYLRLCNRADGEPIPADMW